MGNDLAKNKKEKKKGIMEELNVIFQIKHSVKVGAENLQTFMFFSQKN